MRAAASYLYFHALFLLGFVRSRNAIRQDRSACNVLGTRLVKIGLVDVLVLVPSDGGTELDEVVVCRKRRHYWSHRSALDFMAYVYVAMLLGALIVVVGFALLSLRTLLRGTAPSTDVLVVIALSIGFLLLSRAISSVRFLVSNVRFRKHGYSVALRGEYLEEVG